MKKYSYYILSSESFTDTFENYREALIKFNQIDESATLYGFDEQNDSTVIFSK